MAKIRRESRAPEQNALRCRGIPSPEYDRRPYRAPRWSRTATRRAPVIERGEPLGKRLASAAGEMRASADRVAELKAAGADYRAAAMRARTARHAWLELQGGISTHAVDPAGYEAPSR